MTQGRIDRVPVFIRCVHDTARVSYGPVPGPFAMRVGPGQYLRHGQKRLLSRVIFRASHDGEHLLHGLMGDTKLPGDFRERQALRPQRKDLLAALLVWLPAAVGPASENS